MNQRSNYQHSLDHGQSERVPEKHLLLLHWLPKAFGCVDHNKLWKILKDMGIPGHLTCLLRNLYAGHKQQLEVDMEQLIGKIGKGVRQGSILSPCLFNLYAECTLLRAQSVSHIWLFVMLWTVACQAPLSMGFSRQEYWSGLWWPLQGDLPNSEIKPDSLMSPALAGGFFTASATWEACICRVHHVKCQVGWINHKLKSRLLGEISTTSYADDIPL